MMKTENQMWERGFRGGRGGGGGEKVHVQCIYMVAVSLLVIMLCCHGILNAGRQLLVSTSAAQASPGFSEHLPSSLPSPRSLQPHHDLQKRGGERERVGEGGEGRRGEV